MYIVRCETSFTHRLWTNKPYAKWEITEEMWYMRCDRLSQVSNGYHISKQMFVHVFVYIVECAEHHHLYQPHQRLLATFNFS